MNRITGRSAFLALLRDEGITHLFGNPGTTELPIMHALKEHPDLTYVMAMQEGLVVAIADGYGRASGRLVACNVHVAPGLSNAMGSLFSTRVHRHADDPDRRPAGAGPRADGTVLYVRWFQMASRW